MTSQGRLRPQSLKSLGGRAISRRDTREGILLAVLTSVSLQMRTPAHTSRAMLK